MSRRMGLAIGGGCISQQRAQITSLGLGGGALEVSLLFEAGVGANPGRCLFEGVADGSRTKGTRGDLGQTHTDRLMGGWPKTGPGAKRYDTKGQDRTKTRHGQVIKQ